MTVLVVFFLHVHVFLVNVLQGAVRLAGGPNEYSGRVELFDKGDWKILCDENWNLRKGQIVCRQLGFFNVTWTRTIGVMEFWLHKNIAVRTENRRCTGREDTLQDCELYRSIDIPGKTRCQKTLVLCQGESGHLISSAFLCR